jgi:hypothetical protein
MPKKKQKAKAKPKKKTSHKRKRSKVSSSFPINITNQGGTTHVVPNKQPISICKKDEVYWHSPGHSIWVVNFDGPNGSPFSHTVFSNKPGYSTHSGAPTNAVPNTDYKYTAQIDNATPEDPIIHTDP